MFSHRRFGHSLGSSVSVFAAVHLAEQLNITIAGVILQSCFLSMYRVVDDFRFTSSHDMYCSCDIVGAVVFLDSRLDAFHVLYV